MTYRRQLQGRGSGGRRIRNSGGGSPCIIPAFTANPVATDPTGMLIGETVFTTDGTYVGTAVVVTYQWRRDGANIGGAVANSYVLTAADIGPLIDCVVTLTGACGVASADSNDLQWTVAGTYGADLIWDYDASTVVLVGADVDVWPDQSGRGNDVAAAAAANRPLWIAGGSPSGADVVQFDGASEYLRSAAIALGGNLTEATHFVVARTDAYISGRRYFDYRSGQFILQQTATLDQKATSVTAVGLSNTTTALTGVFEVIGFSLTGLFRETWLNGVQEDLDGPSAAMNVLDGAALSLGGANAGALLCSFTSPRMFAARRGSTTQELQTVSAGLAYLYL